jgi:hypothetical protein
MCDYSVSIRVFVTHSRMSVCFMQYTSFVFVYTLTRYVSFVESLVGVVVVSIHLFILYILSSVTCIHVTYGGYSD